MKKLLFTLLAALPAFYCHAQISSQEMTHRKDELALATSDTARAAALLYISGGYRFSNIDSALYYINQANLISRKAGWLLGEASALSFKGSIFLESGNIPDALKYLLAALNVADKMPDSYYSTELKGHIENYIGNVYMELGEYKTSILHYRTAETLYAKIGYGGVYNEMSNIGNDYEMIGSLDSAKLYLKMVFDKEIHHPNNSEQIIKAELRQRLGNLEIDLGHYDTALMHYRIGVREAFATNDLRNLSVLYLKMALLFKKLKANDSSFYYARKTLVTSSLVSMKKSIYQASTLLSTLFELKHQQDSALFYAKLSANEKDSLYGPEIFRQLQLITLQEQQRQQELQEENDRLRYRYLLGAMLSAAGFFLLIAFILWRSARRQKSANQLLSRQKEEILSQQTDLQKAFANLKQTQNQLIQSEKMASLGELTASIAHEIQNPLNFVNNFSEVNHEMIDELKEELKGGNLDEALSIADDIQQNEEKINHHGKRADAIVKGMLQHSRTSSGHKEPTDLNALTDEYMRLAYHGLRVKDKSFNAEMATHFDANLPKINVVAQDIGRVLLNLFNNAFYAVNQKAKTVGPGYMPEVMVSIYAENGQVIIKVKDNGMGIPDAIKDKIMQPFFTTKPTGAGTGLGLSLTYDMVVKGHGGSITVDTKVGSFTEFSVTLPV